MRIFVSCVLVAAACSSDPPPPPRTEVAVAPPPAAVSASVSVAPSATVAPSAAPVATTPLAPPPEEATPDAGLAMLGAVGGSSGAVSVFGSGDLDATGAGGGGRGEGIGLGNLDPHGHGAGQGFGNGHGRLGGARSNARLRQGATAVSGRLPPEVIQRIVRQSFGRTKRCFEAGLAKNPHLTGRVYTKFVIDASGEVSSAQSTSQTTLADMSVVSCVVRVFRSLQFPSPEGGVVTVVYPLIFTPADD